MRVDLHSATIVEDDTEPVSRTRALIEHRMTHRSLAELGRDIGISQIAVKLRSAAQAGRLPDIDLLERLCEHVNVNIAELVIAGFADAGYTHLLPFDDAESVQLATKILTTTPRKRAVLSAMTSFLDSLPDDPAPGDEETARFA